MQNVAGLLPGSQANLSADVAGEQEFRLVAGPAVRSVVCKHVACLTNSR